MENEAIYNIEVGTLNQVIKVMEKTWPRLPTFQAVQIVSNQNSNVRAKENIYLAVGCVIPTREGEKKKYSVLWSYSARVSWLFGIEIEAIAIGCGKEKVEEGRGGQGRGGGTEGD